MEIATPFIIRLAFIGIPLILFIFWFLKSKTEVRKMVVVFSALAVMFFGLARNRADNLDYERDKIVFSLSNNSIHYSDELLKPFSYDASLIAYHAITGLLLVMIAILELKLYQWKQKNA